MKKNQMHDENGQCLSIQCFSSRHFFFFDGNTRITHAGTFNERYFYIGIFLDLRKIIFDKERK